MLLLCTPCNGTCIVKGGMYTVLPEFPIGYLKRVFAIQAHTEYPGTTQYELFVTIEGANGGTSVRIRRSHGVSGNTEYGVI